MGAAVPVRVAAGRARAFLLTPILIICIPIICVLIILFMAFLLPVISTHILFYLLLTGTSVEEVSLTPPPLLFTSLCSPNLSSLSAPLTGTCRTMLHSARADTSSNCKRSFVVPHMGIHSAWLVLGSYARTLPSKISPRAMQMNSPL